MTLKYQINKPINIVFEYLTDMQKFVKVHPIIFKIEEKGENNYRIFEKLNILVPITFTYPAKVTGNTKTNEVIITAVVQKIIHVNMLFKLEAEGNKTRIIEIVNFRSLLPVSFIMSRIFKKQHALLFQNIESLN